MEKILVIVESPTKARTIAGILGKDVLVRATMGHIRDLPAKEFGIDIANNFTPTYQTIYGKSKIIEGLKKMAGEASEIYLATDEDREGEAIAWHAAYAIGKDPETLKRVAFHEITPDAVREAFASPRQISMNLVNAQQTRRLLDRLVGYKLSPFLDTHLSRNLGRGLSAGRVQSVALRIIVEREKEIEAFVPQTYFTIDAIVEKEGKTFSLRLVAIGGKTLEQLTLTDEQKVLLVIESLRQGTLAVSSIEETRKDQYPYPPFVTSSLQQEASIKLSFSAIKTMMIAQQLYEGIAIGEKGTVGLITYMRTDSPTAAQPAQYQARKLIGERFGAELLPERPPYYKARQASAQEAHECIRPTSVFRTPDDMKKHLTADQHILYDLIWKRFIASQMKPANIRTLTITAANGEHLFKGSRNTIAFPGFMSVWPVKFDEGTPVPDGIATGETLPVREYVHEQQSTKPPPRYTEASLIRMLEKNNIGRPSTYAPTLATLMHRGYVQIQRRTIHPLSKGRIVSDLLVRFFSEVIRIDFTAEMEEDLDKIAEGEKDWVATLKKFYDVFGPTLAQAEQNVSADKEFLKTILIEETKICKKCGKPLIMRRSKYGSFFGCTGYPECKYIEKVESNARYPRNRFKKRSGRPSVPRKV